VDLVRRSRFSPCTVSCVAVEVELSRIAQLRGHVTYGVRTLMLYYIPMSMADAHAHL
jgi:hypothetical protein